MLKRILIVTVVIFINIGCAKFRLNWPISLKAVSGFNDNEKEKIYEWLEEINQYSNSILIDFSESHDGSSLYISKKEDIPKFATRVAGRATLEYQKCTIEILSLVSNDDDLFKTILWHELGHCAGLEHVPERGEIMYKEAIPFSNLSKEAVERFLNQFILSVGK